ncbi:MAG: phosphoserine phosphatase RsbU/P [Gaiellales bacterium]|jgi:sigma-B regulation protein RsbU (phosphoserine phosphatase)|nr:phosphoserine phosphatase RsbU/P [Gaiellales bacterium]
MRLENESERLAAVRRYDVLDTPPDGAFDRITSLAARLFQVPIALVTIVDHDRIWFKSHHGVGPGEIGRDPGLCASAILQEGPYVVTDAVADPRTLANPLVAGEMGLRFYAAAPLRTADGYNLGTVCVLDTSRREVTEDEMATLGDLAAIVIDELELRRSARLLHDQEEDMLKAATSFARTLQQSLMPAQLPEVPGWDLAAHFAPADPREVSGDFYDVFGVREGVTAIAVGDVAGKGPRAAAATSLVRNSLRTAVLDADEPGQALAILNRTMRQSEYFGLRQQPGYCTVALAYLDTTSGSCEVTIARAGHVRPLIADVQGGVRATTADGPLLGLTDKVTFTTEMIALAEDDMVVFYTDGLTEARAGTQAVGLRPIQERLSKRARGATASDVTDVIRTFLSTYETGVRDDVAVLVARAVA